MSNHSKHPRGSPASARSQSPGVTHHHDTPKEPPFVPNEGNTTRRLSGLPELAHGDLALLTSKQEIVIATGTIVQGYTLQHSEVQYVWQAVFNEPVTAIADSITGVIVGSGASFTG